LQLSGVVGMWRCVRHAGDDGGAAAVEFALVLPLLVVLLLAIVEFGLVFNAQLGVTYAAREGARMAAINVATFSKEAVQERARPLETAKVAVGDPVLVPDVSGDYYSVTVSYPYQLDIPLPGGNQSLTLSSTAKMRIEN